MKIGRLQIDNPIFLAPMAGISDYPFRLLCKEYGAGLVYSEFVSADGIFRANEKTLSMIRFSDEERPIGIQIFGDSPEVMAEAARMINKQFRPDLIDINYGCPVPKVTKRGAGSAALRDLNLMDEITLAVVEAVPKIPVTVKMRAGWDQNRIVVPEAGVRLEQCGIKAITLHPRTAKQSYGGSADWALIKELKAAVDMPVIGNGDIKSVEDMRRMFDTTGCDAVMIGRAALGNPFIFRELKAAWQNARLLAPPTLKEQVALCIRHLNMQVDYCGAQMGANMMRKHFGWYLKSFPGAPQYRNRLVTATDVNEMLVILNEIADYAVQAPQVQSIG